jgi:hypothetical protein
MLKREYLRALVCFLLIPVVAVAIGPLFAFIDPEMARGHANYVRNYRLLELGRTSALVAMAGLVLLLWIACCYLVLRSRQRSPAWLPLSIAGPFGFAVIAALRDLSPLPDDLYQKFIANLKSYWRVLVEVALFVAAWWLAFELVMAKHELMTRYQAFITGRSMADIIAEQNASSGMWAFSEGNQTMYVVILLYLLWPMLFNFAGRVFASRSTAA